MAGWLDTGEPYDSYLTCGTEWWVVCGSVGSWFPLMVGGGECKWRATVTLACHELETLRYEAVGIRDFGSASTSSCVKFEDRVRIAALRCCCCCCCCTSGAGMELPSMHGRS
jgi:hypothetical protein